MMLMLTVERHSDDVSVDRVMPRLERVLPPSSLIGEI